MPKRTRNRSVTLNKPIITDDKHSECDKQKKMKTNSDDDDVSELVACNDVSSPTIFETVVNFSDDEDETLNYEQFREKRLKENMKLFECLGVNQAADALMKSLKKVTPPKKNKPKTNQVKQIFKAPTRRSLRLSNVPAPATPEINLQNEKKIDNDDDDDDDDSSVLNQESISVANEDNTFFEKLSADLIVKETVDDFHTCDFKRFTNVVKSLEMKKFFKLSTNRIYSLAIHPSETSLVVAVGDIKGNISFYNNENSDSRMNQVHAGPVNCVSFCSWDSQKIFSTSHDGSVRCGDIVSRSFDMIYTTKLRLDAEKSLLLHSTWHTEFERSLLIATGSGYVDLIDTRVPNKIQNTAWCHERSVRTVQCHPLEKNYFVTSSGIGEVSLWDIRNITSNKILPVLEYNHSIKPLTSAFFSDTGKKMITTSRDDKIRIFDTSKLNAKSTKPTLTIPHNNCTNRWISVIKAKWNPGRDDAFFVTSMQLPKQIEIYNANGSLLCNLRSSNMTTYCPVIEVHPTQAIYVAGNSSGLLHIFSTEQQQL